MTKGIKGFQKGEHWKGNRNGRPPSTPRELFTNKYFKANEQRIWKIWDRILDLAEQDKKWAMERVADTWTSRPRSEVLVDSCDANFDQAKSIISEFSPELLERIKEEAEKIKERRANNNGEGLMEEHNG